MALKSHSLIIGSDEKADIVCRGKHISPIHAKLTRTSNEIVLEDLNSTFGTYVNGRKINTATVLRNSDRVKLGHMLFHWNEAFHPSSKEDIFWRDLISTQGTISWSSYKIVLLVIIGISLVLPVGISIAFKLYNMTPVNFILIFTATFWTFLLYIAINITRKLIRAKSN